MRFEQLLMFRDLTLFLSAARWISAWLVMLGHARTAWFVPWREADRSLIFDAFAWSSGFGHTGVMVFFVLSGYLVGGRVLDTHRAGKGFKKYFLDRFTRMYLVMIPVFAFTYFLVRLNAFQLDLPELLERPENSWQSLAVNFVFLQTVLAPPFAGNYPLWSLFNEFWYYLLTPLLVASVAAWKGRNRVLGLLGLAALLFAFGTGFVVAWLIWLMGLAVRLNWVPRINTRWAIVVWIGFIASLRTFFPGGNLATDLIQGALFAVVIASFDGANAGPPRPSRSLHHDLADWSFSLYVLHAPIITCIAIFLSRKEGTLGLQPTIINGFGIVGALIVVLLASWLFSLITEKQTGRVRRWVYSRVGVPPDVATAP